MMSRQGGRCLICGGVFGDKRPHVDHDHACDHPDKGTECCADCVRGILCNSCNHFLGWLEPRIHLLAPALRYLGTEISDP